MISATAPGKVILFGEHAVVYGEPALAVAVSLRTTVMAREGGAHHTVNGYPLSEQFHAHIKQAVDLVWGNGPPLILETESNVPSAAGLGSSAALTTATVSALLALQDKFTPEEAARRAYDVEWTAQGGRGSPTDTSTVAHGEAVLVDGLKRENLLWTISRGDRTWHLHHHDVPRGFTLVVGNTGQRGRTAEQVAKVAKLTKRSAFARDVVRDIGKLTRQGVAALERGDKAEVGRLMTRNHHLLHILGVSTPKLDELVEAVTPLSHGAKLTGSGGGGSMIALTDRPKEVAEMIRKRGATPYTVSLGGLGVEIL
ncbi:MAG TPA: mevalonate kinase [Candidatus Thermoplasmatota archaeon]|nr:mevalonate kinase [Candidatus Thermoplasmatota archaeon]